MSNQDDVSRYIASDIGTKEFIAKNAVILTRNAEGRRQARNLTQVPIDHYRLRGWITPDQHDAGERFFAIWFRGAERSKYVQLRYTVEATGAGLTFEALEKLEERYNAAVKAIGDDLVAMIIREVVCHGEYLTGLRDENAKKVGKNRRMKLLKDGLDALVKHFKI